MPSPSQTGRRGVGALLVVILSMVVVLAIVGMGQRYLTSAVNTQTQRTSLGDMCLELAESAIEEALWQFRWKANDQNSSNAARDSIFDELRRDRYSGKPSALSLSDRIKTPQLDKILKEPAYARFSLRELTADVIYQQQLVNLAYERFGLLRLRAVVRFDLSLTESVAREVEVAVGFKTCLIGPPRPFDQPTFMLLVPDAAPTGFEFAELNSKTREYTAMVKETHDDVLQRANDGNTPSTVQEEYREIAGLVQPAASWQTRLPDLATERTVMMANRGDAETVDLSALFILKKLEEREKAELTQSRKDVELALRRVTTEPDDLNAHRQLIAAYRKRAKALASVLTIMAEHRLLFSPPEIAAQVFPEVLPCLSKLKEEGHWQFMSFSSVGELLGDPAEQLFRIAATAHPLNGIVKVNNPSKVLNLTNPIPGKLVIVVGKGGVRLANLKSRDNDLLTVISLGGNIKVEGEVHASIIGAQGASFSATPGSTIVGNLVLDRIPAPEDRQVQITYAKKFHSGITTETTAEGAFADYYYVSTSPRIVYRKVTRR